MTTPVPSQREMPADRRGELLAVAAVAGAVLTLGLGLVFAVLADAAMERGGLTRLDSSITRWAVDRRSGGLTDVMQGITRLGSASVLVPLVLVVALVLMLRRRFVLAGFLVVATLGASAMNTLVKGIVGRARPPLSIRLDAPGGSSFPSGHSAGSFACYGALAIIAVILLRHRLRRMVAIVVAGLAVVAIGFSRVYLGVHWASDVLSGWVLAATWLAVLVTLLALATRYRRAARSGPRRSAHLPPSADDSP